MDHFFDSWCNFQVRDCSVNNSGLLLNILIFYFFVKIQKNLGKKEEKNQTKTKSAETISGVTKDNQKNAEEIRDIVKKFTK